MNNLPSDNELESELQEIYILARHWLQDIAYMEEELHFFKNILDKYQPLWALSELQLKSTEFCQKIKEQEQHLTSLKIKIPDFFTFLEPYIGDLKKEMGLGFLEKFNAFQTELLALFATVEATKKDLFNYTSTIIDTEKNQLT